MTPDIVSIASEALRAEINPFGAELWRLQDAAGRDLLWDGDAAWWTGRAPLLFPIIGRLPGDRFTHAGRAYELPKHGLARRRAFEVTAHEPGRAVFRLAADEESRQVYPFDFVLEAAFAVAGAELRMTATIRNAGAEPLPATFGFHPAFRWPLAEAGDRAAQTIAFAEPEPGPLRRLDETGLLGPARLATPVANRALALRDDLFVDDAVILEGVASRSVRYGGDRGPALTVSWSGLPHLGIWTRPGAPYVCIEPWLSLPAQADAPQEIVERPDLLHLAPGAAHQVSMCVRID